MCQGWAQEKFIKLDRIKVLILETRAGAQPGPMLCIKSPLLVILAIYHNLVNNIASHTIWAYRSKDGMLEYNVTFDAHSWCIKIDHFYGKGHGKSEPLIIGPTLRIPHLFVRSPYITKVTTLKGHTYLPFKPHRSCSRPYIDHLLSTIDIFPFFKHL